jgi:hypothetical protein
MPTNGLVNTSGFTTAPNTIGLVAGASGFTGNTGVSQNRITVRVTAIGESGNIYYEFVLNLYGKSKVGTPNFNNIAIPSSANNIIMPDVGEYVEIYQSYEPIAAGQNKANPIKVMYWDSSKGPLNIWNELTGSQKSLDPTVQNQVQDQKMSNIGVPNYINSFNGF